jgi:hypothetical protein
VTQWIDGERTVLVTQYDDGTMTVATREHPAAIWGPPITVRTVPAYAR